MVKPENWLILDAEAPSPGLQSMAYNQFVLIPLLLCILASPSKMGPLNCIGFSRKETPLSIKFHVNKKLIKDQPPLS